MTLILIYIKMKKNVAELGHNGRLKIYVDPKKFRSARAFKSIPITCSLKPLDP